MGRFLRRNKIRPMRHPSRLKSFAAWLSSFTFCCCCIFPAAAPRPPQKQIAQQVELPEQKGQPEPSQPEPPKTKAKAKPAEKPASAPTGSDPFKLPPRPEVSADDKGLLERKSFTVKIELPPPKPFKSNVTASASTLTVTIIGGEIGRTKYMRKTVDGLRELTANAEQLNLRVRVTSEAATKTYKYVPWHASADKSFVKYESGTHAIWKPGAVSWPTGGVEQAMTIAPGKSIVDAVSVPAPLWNDEEIDITLAGANLGVADSFRLKFGRSVFESEDKRKIDLAAKVKDMAEAEERRLNLIEDVRIATVQRRIDDADAAWKKEVARIEAAKEAKVEADRLAAERAAEAKLPKVSRRNYNKITRGMDYDEVVGILGYGKQNATSGGFAIYTWRHNEPFVGPVVISITFRGGYVDSKAIAD